MHYVYVHRYAYYIILYQLKLTKMFAELAYINDCAVPFLSCAGVNLCWYYHTYHKNNCQKIWPEHFVITKRNSILRASCFCEKYIHYTYGARIYGYAF